MIAFRGAHPVLVESDSTRMLRFNGLVHREGGPTGPTRERGSLPA